MRGDLFVLASTGLPFEAKVTMKWLLLRCLLARAYSAPIAHMGDVLKPQTTIADLQTIK
jgi:hypothetical protein